MHTRRPTPSPRHRWLHIASACCIAIMATNATALAEYLSLRRTSDPMGLTPDVAPTSENASDPSGFENGAPLKTDPELERLLERAEQFQKQNRLDVAVVMWQKALNESGDTLVTEDGRVYTSMSVKIERILSRLSPEGRKIYRRNADPEASEILAAESNRTQALSKVVRQYFLSSRGDEAAMELGCLALDGHDFVGACRHFERLLTDYPDSDIPRDEILLRLAVANAYLGDSAGAKSNLKALANATSLPREVVDHVALLARKSARQSLPLANSQDWHMPWANAARNGVQPSLDKDFCRGQLVEIWARPIDSNSNNSVAIRNSSTSNDTLKVGAPSEGDEVATSSGEGVYRGSTSILSGIIPVGDVTFGRSLAGRLVVVPGGGAAADESANQPSIASQRENQTELWKTREWIPTQQLLFDKGRIYFKSTRQISCWNTRPFESEPVWKSASDRVFEIDFHSQVKRAQGQGGLRNEPSTDSDIQNFGDRVHASFSLCDGVIYNIEGRPPNEPIKSPQNGNQPRRSRRNFLAAYDAQTGAALWRRGADNTDKQSAAGFLAAPVRVGGAIIAPITDGGVISLLAMSPSKGDTVWKTYLCDEPSGGCAPWSPVCLAVEGSEVYVVAGTGVVFALDGITGSLRWATRYPRSGTIKFDQAQSQGAAPQLDLSGWEEEAIVPQGATLLVMASDSDRLLALDRRTGSLRWETPRLLENSPEVSYCLGVADGGIFVAGKRSIRRYDCSSGKLIWQCTHETSYGHGALTANTVYLPVKNSILSLDIAKGKELAQTGVTLAVNDPVGNLYSNGEYLWTVGGDRIAALINIEFRLAQLNKAIAAGNIDAHFDRMALMLRYQRNKEAFVDLNAGYEALLKQNKIWRARALRLDGLKRLDFARTDPLAALAIAQSSATGDAPVTAEEIRFAESTAQERRNLIAAALFHVARTRPQGAVHALLATAPLCDEPRIQAALLSALKATASRDDLPAFRAALTHASPRVRQTAAELVVALGGAESAVLLRPLLVDTNEEVRIAAAALLLSLGERASLPVLVRGLESNLLSVRVASLRSLRFVANESLAYVATDAPDARESAIASWKDWLAKQGDTVALPKAGNPSQFAGHTLICLGDRDAVVEFDARGEEFMVYSIRGATDAKFTPDGTRLIFAAKDNAFYEFNALGKLLRKKNDVSGEPRAGERLPNGNTLVACRVANGVWEFSPEGKTIWQTTVAGGPLHAKRLENGNTLVTIQSGRVAEINPAGQVVWQLQGLRGPAAAQRLENGNTLVAIKGENAVVEFNVQYERVSSIEGLRLPKHMQQLSDGATLVSDLDGLHIYDAARNRVQLILLPTIINFCRN